MFLMDGTPTGRIKCSLDNFIPRTDIAESKKRTELSQTGIYLLFGTNDETPSILAGQEEHNPSTTHPKTTHPTPKKAHILSLKSTRREKHTFWG